MADNAKTEHGAGHGERDGGERSHVVFKFSVDGRHYESEQPVLTGQQIKARAGVDASFGLFIEGHGHGPDQQIADTQSVDLRMPGLEHFYTAPPATYGSVAPSTTR